MKISEKQIQALISFLTIIAGKYPFAHPDNTCIIEIRNLLDEIQHQQSDELMEIKL